MRLCTGILVLVLTVWGASVHAAASGLDGMVGTAGAGFTDFTIVTPKPGFKIDRGTYVTASIQRPFNFMQLHLSLGLSNMMADGLANYRYTNTTAAYAADDVALKAKMLDLSLGLKWMIIEGFWFRPYVGGGGIAGYHEVSYVSKANILSLQGDDYKKKDTIMGSGYYGEGGLEIEFTPKFGIQLAARLSDYTSKPLETLDNQKIHFRAETYYFSALIGF